MSCLHVFQWVKTGKQQEPGQIINKTVASRGILSWVRDQKTKKKTEIREQLKSDETREVAYISVLADNPYN